MRACCVSSAHCAWHAAAQDPAGWRLQTIWATATRRTSIATSSNLRVSRQPSIGASHPPKLTTSLSLQPGTAGEVKFLQDSRARVDDHPALVHCGADDEDQRGV